MLSQLTVDSHAHPTANGTFAVGIINNTMLEKIELERAYADNDLLANFSLEQLHSAVSNRVAGIKDAARKVCEWDEVESIPRNFSKQFCVEENRRVWINLITGERKSILDCEVYICDVETVHHPDFCDRLPFSAIAYGGDGESWGWVNSRIHPVEVIPVGNGTLVNFMASYDAGYLSSFYTGKPYYLDIESLGRCFWEFSKNQAETLIALKRKKWTPDWADLAVLGPNGEYKLSLVRLATHLKLDLKYPWLNSHKDTRLDIVKSTWEDAFNHLDDYLFYNYRDVQVTLDVAQAVLRRTLREVKCDRTWLGWAEMSRMLFQIDHDWLGWLEQCDQIESLKNNEIIEILGDAAYAYLLKHRTTHTEKYELYGYADDGLDWKKLKAGKFKGCPNWYSKYLRDLAQGKGITGPTSFVILEATFLDFPIVKRSVKIGTKNTNGSRLWYVDDEMPKALPDPKGGTEKNFQGLTTLWGSGVEFWYKNNLLQSPSGKLEYIQELYCSISWWQKMRDRLKTVRPVNGLVKPRIAVNGTLTHRAADKIWLVAAKINPKTIGTELICKVRPLPGHLVVWADVDQQELRLAATLADLKTGEILSCEYSRAILLGDKDQGTDMHTINSRNVGIPRDPAKNYGFASQYLGGVGGLMRAAFRHLPKEYFSKYPTYFDAISDALGITKRFISSYRGYEVAGTYTGGFASDYFTMLKKLASAPRPRTLLNEVPWPPVVCPTNIGDRDLPTRANHVIQSAGVDQLHTNLSFISVLADHFGLEFQLMLTWHDALYWSVKIEHVKKFTEIFQAAHLLTWILYFDALGFKDIPVPCMYYSSVDVDDRIRKNAENPCITLSNPKGFDPFTGL